MKAAFVHHNIEVTEQQTLIPKGQGQDAENLNRNRDGMVGSIQRLVK